MKKAAHKIQKKPIITDIIPDYRWPLFAAVSIALGLITSALYFKSLFYGFQFDDLPNISKCFAIRHNTFFKLFFSGPRWVVFWLNAIIYKIDYLHPFWYRAIDVSIHMLNGILVFVLLLFCLDRMRENVWLKSHAFFISLMTSVLFLIHPVQSQTVCYVIQGQMEGLATLSLLLLLSCLCVVAYSKKTWQKRVAFFSALFISLVAPGIKEITIVIPLLLVCWDWFLVAQQSGESLRSRFGFHILILLCMWGSHLYLLKPEFFLEILGFAVTIKSNPGNVLTSSSTVLITPFYWMLTQCKAILHYLYIFIWPFSICIEYDWKLVESLFSFDFIVPAILCAVIGAGVIVLLAQQSTRFLGFGLLWFFISMAPRTSIIPSAELCVDYKTYMGSIGIFFVVSIAVLMLISLIASRIQHIRFIRVLPSIVVSSALIIPFALGTFDRQTVWSSGLLFWGDVIAKAPHKARAYNNYGTELSNAGRYAESIPYFMKAMAIDSHYADPINNCAVAYAGLSNIDKAIEMLERSLQLNPFFPEGYNNIAGMYQKKGDFENAEKALMMAIKLRPHYGKAWHNLGLLYVEQKKMEKAWECFKTCCYNADLDDDRGFHSFAKASIQLKRYDDAIAAYERLLQSQRDNTEAVFHLANAYFLAKRFDDALVYYKKLLESDPHDPRLLINIGETYCEKGEPANALTYFGQLQDYKRQFPSLCVRMARCYRDLGDTDNARSLLREVYTLNPSPGIVKSAQEIMATLV